MIKHCDAEAEAPILWPSNAKSWLIWKDPDAGKYWRQEEKETTEDEMVVWHQWTWVGANSRRWWRTGKPAVLQSMGSQRVRHHWGTEQQQWKRVLLLLVAQLCLTLCSPMDCSPPGSSVHGIFQARILEWVAISYSRGSSWPRDQTHVSYVSCTGSQILYC